MRRIYFLLTISIAAGQLGARCERNLPAPADNHAAAARA